MTGAGDAPASYAEIEPLLAGLQYRKRVIEATFVCPNSGMKQVGRCLYQARYLRGPAAMLWRQALGQTYPGGGPAVRLQRGPQPAVLEAFDSVREHFSRDPASGRWLAASRQDLVRPARQALFARLCELPASLIEALLRSWGLVSGMQAPKMAQELASLSDDQQTSLTLLDALWRNASGRPDAPTLLPLQPELDALVINAVREADPGSQGADLATPSPQRDSLPGLPG